MGREALLICCLAGKITRTKFSSPVGDKGKREYAKRNFVDKAWKEISREIGMKSFRADIQLDGKVVVFTTNRPSLIYLMKAICPSS